MSEATRMILGLAIGIVVMIVLVMKTKIHTFIALLMAAAITGSRESAMFSAQRSKRRRCPLF